MPTLINGVPVDLSANDLNQNLLSYLREDRDLTGTKDGCGAGFCGTCTILINGKTAKACQQKIADIVGKTVLTIEGMAQPDGSLHPLQQSFIDAGAVQCGFCIPGMILTAHAFLQKNSQPTRPEIRKSISANLCRCTGYQQIIDAIEAAAPAYQISNKMTSQEMENVAK